MNRWSVSPASVLHYLNHTLIVMLTKEDHEFVGFLFGKLLKHVDTDMLDLQDDDSCCDHIQLSLLE
ncbi:hypothetical protein, partial [Acinetobacter baumannii]|uniref:hypothetical protein n=1 Tax=Acinetobacter baumannii TaxID=470 RepID=UPI001CBCDB4D